jgi:UDP-3-O-[3-hydroxymyristoyl] glucosamine N-acyltransferase
MSRENGISLGTIASLAGGRVEGDAAFEIRRPAPLHDAGPSDLALLADEKYLAAVADSGAGALITTPALSEQLDDPRPRVLVENPRAALLPLMQQLDPTPRFSPGVHPTAVLAEGVLLGQGVSIGPYAVLEEGAVIGDGTRVGSHSVIGPGATLGRDCYLHPHVVVYAGVAIGDRAILQAGARVGSDGFGFVVHEGAYRKIPHVGGCILGDDVEIGANSCVDRGSMGDTSVGSGTKLDNLVQIAHNVKVGEHSVFAALVGIGGSTDIGPWAQFGGQSGAVGHLSLGKGVKVSAQAGITNDFPDGAEVTGWPARDLKSQYRVYGASQKLPDALKRLRALEKEVAEMRERLEAPEG